MLRADTDWGIFAHCAAAERPSLALRNPIPRAHFDEKSGLVQCRTSWGTWGRTVDDVQIEVNVEKGTKSKDVKCTIQPKEIALSVRGERESLRQGGTLQDLMCNMHCTLYCVRHVLPITVTPAYCVE